MIFSETSPFLEPSPLPSCEVASVTDALVSVVAQAASWSLHITNAVDVEDPILLANQSIATLDVPLAQLTLLYALNAHAFLNKTLLISSLSGRHPISD